MDDKNAKRERNKERVYPQEDHATTESDGEKNIQNDI